MKSITINNRTLQYKTFHCNSEYGDSTYTRFYEGTTIKTRKKYFFFGPKVTEIVPKHVFTIYEDVNNERLTKDWWKTRILRELELLNRSKELEKGELI